MPFRMAENDAVAKVKVIGVGGGGGNAINTMIDSGLQGVAFIAANTDKQALDQSRADVILQLGPSMTKGLGAGSDPEIGAQAALESIEDIRAGLEGVDMVFVTAGLGGGTGTGAAPVVARVAKEVGALTVAVVTKPFVFEGKARMKNAEKGWEELQQYVDTIITVPNDRLLNVMQKTSKFSEMLSMADSVLLQAVKGITDLINVPGHINADFADLKTVMKEVGPAIMGAGSAQGENRALEAAKKAIDNQLLEDVGIDGARGLLINISASEETLSMSEFMEASALIQEKVDDDAKVVIGALYDDSLGDELHITVIATGVGEAMKKNEAISQVSELPKPMSTGRQREQKYQPSSTIPASPNKQPRVTRLPSSDFNSIDKYGGTGPSSTTRGQESSLSWNEDYLETPTYLRKKAN